MSEIELEIEPVPPTDEEALKIQIQKQMRDYNRNDMPAWAECDREIERLVNLIP